MTNPLGLPESQFKTWIDHMGQVVSNCTRYATKVDEPVSVVNDSRIKQLIVWTESQHEINMILELVARSGRNSVPRLNYRIRVKGPTTANRWLPVFNTVALTNLLSQWRRNLDLNPKPLPSSVLPPRVVTF